MEFENAWLEVKGCADSVQTASVNEQALEVPAISEVLEAAASTNKLHPGMWDYSRRLDKVEVEMVRGALGLSKTAEDGRAVSLSVSVAYKGSCYTLTLFAIKRSQ
ncbi:MAG: hypothetical protein QXX64_06735 [Nitrososphaera sp.]|uniref:Uncharacterized protein n=1 Tax=Nitrososphaera gargensis (strain Ga9.2) TaxID=1237085 RepID=K0ICZ4_NITGG|nr:hypothetical protein [Candidatus Nitrososphaera gargensis]AFU59241.1 hypothetical protein Ngar_c23150 [Candidatus Nitrososphaera gargensis Ga9.2]